MKKASTENWRNQQNETMCARTYHASVLRCSVCQDSHSRGVDLDIKDYILPLLPPTRYKRGF
ncbi:hypothetical protein F9C07_2968 [Aspergillus flavus]|uniref:Uncharacterized protein n=1 Tax=Aspergillus flavus (strain ATCC 200026 / FGSC A1120 / IAM 13836 / NRRL 3357 / JCM 12722 / SRRC 167) TaxID=332952 RepID=A0A7U2ME68_ASPFN|nr:hypothetical protein F9C07_2968 [Aspergillus flavus]